MAKNLSSLTAFSNVLDAKRLFKEKYPQGLVLVLSHPSLDLLWNLLDLLDERMVDRLDSGDSVIVTSHIPNKKNIEQTALVLCQYGHKAMLDVLAIDPDKE